MAKKETKSTYKKQELVDLIGGLQQVENLKGQALAVISHQNVTMINELLSDIEEKAHPDPAFITLAQEMQQYDMENELDKIKEKEALPENAKLIEARKKQLEVVSGLLQEEVECELFKIERKELPLDITPKQLGMIHLILK